jgi:hypothetical protein
MNLIARTGQKDIDSNKRKSALVNFPVRATEHALHESHVRIDERQTYHLARFSIGLRHHAADATPIFSPGTWFWFALKKKGAVLLRLDED